MRIKETVEGLCKKYDTRDPFQLVDDTGGVLLFENLGSTHGYYSHCYGQKFIHVNNRLDKQQQIVTCAHELGHSILHPDVSTPYLKANTLFSVNKLEIQANNFMVQLLITDDDLIEFFAAGLSSYQIANIYGLPVILIEHKIKTLENRSLQRLDTFLHA